MRDKRNKRKKKEVFIQATSYHGFPYSLFVTGRILSGLALIMGIPFLIINFSESIYGYFKILLLYGLSHLLCYITKQIIGK